MIALFAPDYRFGEALARHLKSCTREADGPYRTWVGTRGGEGAVLYVVEQGADSAYAAARMAVRRGAQMLVPFVDATTTARIQEFLKVPLGVLLPVAASWDVRGLAPLLHVLPDGAEEFPLPPELPTDPVWQAPAGDERAIALATLPWSTGNRFLVRMLRDRLRVAGVDLQLSGYADAAREEDIGLHPLARLVETLDRTGSERIVELAADRLLHDQLEEALGG